MIYLNRSRGQSLIEVVISLTLGIVLIGAAVGAITLSMRSNLDVRTSQTATFLTQELLDNVSSLADSDWHVIYNQPKGSATQYYISSSTRQIIQGVESINVEGKNFSRYFSIENVNRENCGVGNVSVNSSTACSSGWPGASNEIAEDPSTQKITVLVKWSNGAISDTRLINRNNNLILRQTDWASGPRQNNFPTSSSETIVNNKFSTSTSIDYVSVPGSIMPYAAGTTTANFFQNSWQGGLSSNNASHPQDENGWAYYSSSTAVAASSTVNLSYLPMWFKDDGQISTSTPDNTSTGGNFNNGIFTNTAASSSGISESVILGESDNSGANWAQAITSAAWYPRQGFGALVYNNKMWVMGGLGADGNVKNDVWSSSDGITWTRATASANWSPRRHFGALVYNNKMWVMGGSPSPGSDATALNDVWSSSDGINWTRATASASWSVRSKPRVLVYNNKMWLMGGVYCPWWCSYYTDVWYSSDGSNWIKATNSIGWSSRQQFSAVVYNNKMWLMGGYDDSPAYKNDVWSSSDGITWTRSTASAGWSPRMSFGLAVYNNKLWVIGGYSSAGSNNDVWYSSDGINWTQSIASAPWWPRGDFGTLAYNYNIWIMGGLGLVSGYLQTTFNDVWHTYGYPPSGTFESATIDLGKAANFNALSWNATTSAATDIKFQIAVNNDNSSWNYVGPDGTAGSYFSISGTQIPASLNNNRYVRYKAYLSTSNMNFTPYLNDVTISFSVLASNGFLISSPYNTGDPVAQILKINWAASDLSPTEIVKFQIRSSSDGINWSNWCGYNDVGSSCSGSNYFTAANNGFDISVNNPLRNGNNDEWFQYKVDLLGNGSATPVLNNVNIKYQISIPTNGYLVSSVYDTFDLNGASINSIMWQGNVNNGAVKFQIASSDNQNGPWNYLGPGGTSDPYDVYQPAGPNVSIPINLKYNNNQRYFSYKIILEANISQGLRPDVEDVIINWSK